MAKTKVLIAVKTYPTLSEKYDELVCTAGFLEDGSWIRVYPIPYRKLDLEKRYKKWQWVELDLVKNTNDFRPESYRPKDITQDIDIIGAIDCKNWDRRKEVVLKNVHYKMKDLIADAKNPNKSTSLAVFKAKEVIDFVWEPCEREWDKKKLDKVIANQAQGSLFDVEETKKIFNVVQKLPYEFSYKFTAEGDTQHKLMIEDWELGMLYWNSLASSKGDEELACQKVKHKFFDEFYKTRDLYFLLGTTKKFHNVGLNPFIIIGLFYPPKSDAFQLSLKFEDF